METFVIYLGERDERWYVVALDLRSFRVSSTRNPHLAADTTPREAIETARYLRAYTRNPYQMTSLREAVETYEDQR